MIDRSKIKLERGEAVRSIFERTHEEVEEIGRALFERVTISSLTLGQIPAIDKRARLIFIHCLQEVLGGKTMHEIPENELEDIGRRVCQLYFQKLRAGGSGDDVPSH